MIRTQSKRRPGVAIIMALVLMAVLAVVFTAVTWQVVSQRRLLRERERQLQAVWLARAGLEIAAGRLLDSPVPFPEENYVLPDARVHIVVEKKGDDLYAVSAAVELGTQEDPLPVARDLNSYIRRSDKSGIITLHVTSEK
jgi:hypothetical protein